MKQRIYIDNGLVHLESCLQEYDKVFLVHGRGSYVACGAEKAIAPIFSRLGIQVMEFTDFSTNPKDEEAQQGMKRFIQTGAKCILVVGGGSAIDMAKLIRHYALQQHYNASLIAIPTTAGTGAESTHFAVSYVNGVKTSIEADDILPDVAILYPPFTYNNSAYLTACTGFDALAQAIEAYWNKNATPESDEYALNAIRYLHAQLPQCVENATQKLRDDLMIGANWAGKAINITRTTAPHAFSYAFTSKCGYPHGHAVAITFPFFAELNLIGNSKESKLREVLQIKEYSWQTYFETYIQKIGLSYVGTKGQNLQEILNQVNLQRLANNPQSVEQKQIDELYNQLITIKQ